MLDSKIHTLLTLVTVGNYTNTAKVLSMTQPAVSHHIKLLSTEFGVPLFYKDKKTLRLTPEGEILVRYARRMAALEENARQDIEDCRKQAHRFKVGITTTLGEFLVPQVLGTYCSEHPQVHIQILLDTISNLHAMLSSYQIDWAIVEGSMPNQNFISAILDTDYLCLLVSPRHAFAKRKSVGLHELKKEKFIMRSAKAGTRMLFERHLQSHSETIENFNILIEIDNVATIKELVATNLGITIMAHSACREEEASGKLVVVPIENFHMVREINMVYRRDFAYADILEDIRRIYDTAR